MTTQAPVHPLAGLKEELAFLVERIERLCADHQGSSIFLLAPKGRDKTALWQTALHKANARGFPPKVVSFDLSAPLPTHTELIAAMEAPGFLSPAAPRAAVTIAKALGDAASRAPIPWVLQLAVKIVGSLPEIAQQSLSTGPTGTEEQCESGFKLLKGVVEKAGEKPLVLIVENLEVVSAEAGLRATEDIVALVRRGLPIVFIVTADEANLSGDCLKLLKGRTDVGDAVWRALLPASKADMLDITGPAAAQVIDELHQLAAGDVLVFHELWEECRSRGLVIEGPGAEWVWDAEAETDGIGRLSNGAFGALNGIVQQCVQAVGDEKLVRLTLGTAALQGMVFCDEVVADVLWRLGFRFADQYSSEDGHVDKVIDLLDDQFRPALVDEGWPEESRHFHEFQSLLLRHHAKADIPNERRRDICRSTASALENVYADRVSDHAWLIITLYQESGDEQRATGLREFLTAPPSPAARTWELVHLSERMRAVLSEVEWASWVAWTAARLEHVPAVRQQLLKLLNEAICAMVLQGNTESARRLLHSEGDRLLNWGEYQEACETAVQARGLAPRDTTSPTFADGASLQGRCLLHMERYAEAGPFLRQALALREATLGRTHSELSMDLNSLGRCLQESGDLAGAMENFERALAIDESAYGHSDPRVATDVINVGSILLTLGDLEGAREHSARALAIDWAASGPDHPSVARDLYQFGNVLALLGDPEGAKNHLERAMEIDERALGSEHPRVAGRLAALAWVLALNGDPAYAKRSIERALAICEATRSQNRPDFGLFVHILGLVLENMGDLDGAKKNYERALGIFRQFLGEEHPNTKVVKENLEALENKGGG